MLILGALLKIGRVSLIEMGTGIWLEIWTILKIWMILNRKANYQKVFLLWNLNPKSSFILSQERRRFWDRPSERKYILVAAGVVAEVMQHAGSQFLFPRPGIVG
jgi:hypothetical protein